MCNLAYIFPFLLCFLRLCTAAFFLLINKSTVGGFPSCLHQKKKSKWEMLNCHTQERNICAYPWSQQGRSCQSWPCHQPTHGAASRWISPHGMSRHTWAGSWWSESGAGTPWTCEAQMMAWEPDKHIAQYEFEASQNWKQNQSRPFKAHKQNASTYKGSTELV